MSVSLDTNITAPSPGSDSKFTTTNIEAYRADIGIVTRHYGKQVSRLSRYSPPHLDPSTPFHYHTTSPSITQPPAQHTPAHTPPYVVN